MSGNGNVEMVQSEQEYVTVEIKRTKIDKQWHIYEVLEEHRVPALIAECLVKSMEEEVMEDAE